VYQNVEESIYDELDNSGASDFTDDSFNENYLLPARPDTPPASSSGNPPPPPPPPPQRVSRIRSFAQSLRDKARSGFQAISSPRTLVKDTSRYIQQVGSKAISQPRINSALLSITEKTSRGLKKLDSKVQKVADKVRSKQPDTTQL
jgi:hypothetical protein